ncbi:hypothetical protein U1Q18_034965 [Sarracenia purpurea var. burkii]
MTQDAAVTKGPDSDESRARCDAGGRQRGCDQRAKCVFGVRWFFWAAVGANSRVVGCVFLRRLCCCTFGYFWLAAALIWVFVGSYRLCRCFVRALDLLPRLGPRLCKSLLQGVQIFAAVLDGCCRLLIRAVLVFLEPRLWRLLLMVAHGCLAFWFLARVAHGCSGKQAEHRYMKMRVKLVPGKVILMLCIASFLAGSLFTSRTSIFSPGNNDHNVHGTPMQLQKLDTIARDCDHKRKLIEGSSGDIVAEVTKTHQAIQ